MEKKRINSKSLLEKLDLATYAVTFAIFAFSLIFAIVCMITGKQSPVNGYGKYGAYELLQRIGVILLVLVPVILRKLRVQIPPLVTISFNLFIVMAVFCGTFMGLYINTKWWDKFNHVVSGALLGVAGMFFLNAITKNNEKVGSFGIVLYALAFGLMCGAIWEIYEFTGDGLLGTNMQRYRDDHVLVDYVGREALMDTMLDVVADAIGALLAGILCAMATARNRDFLKTFEVKILPKKQAAERACATQATEKSVDTAQAEEDSGEKYDDRA